MSIWTRLEKRIGELAGEIIPDETRDRLNQARMLIEDDPPEAERLLEEIIAERANHPLAHALLGSARLAQGKLDEARSSFDHALAVDSEMAAALLGRGDVELAAAQSESAIDWFERAIDASGGERGVLAEAYRGLGFAHRRTGSLDKAVRELRKAVAEDPENPWSRAALGEALVAAGRVHSEETRRHLRRATRSESPPPLALLALGELRLVDGEIESARVLFEEALAKSSVAHHLNTGTEQVRALIGIADTALLSGEPGDAERRYQEALEKGGDPRELYVRMGKLHNETGDSARALVCFTKGLGGGTDPEILELAMDASSRAGNREAAAEFAATLLEECPDHPGAMVASARGLLVRSKPQAALESLRHALEKGAGAEAHVALAELYAESNSLTDAVDHARTALRLDPTDEAARVSYEELVARRAQALDDAAQSGPSICLAGHKLARLCADTESLAHMAAEAADATADFDRPLLVTVMGEFSSGKSTFVNAFVGAQVAPTGITPTTATINVVKYGADKHGRVIWQSGDVEEIEWPNLETRLSELSATRAAEVAHVEIMLPLPALEKVHIVDTPGLNSILAEHEEIARGFMRRADAVVWLFTAGQAGKASEKEALAELRADGVRVLGVINKADQLRENELEQVVRHLSDELGEGLDQIVPVSARAAFAEDREQANWPALIQALEERFFSRSRELKSAQLRRRLLVVRNHVSKQIEARLASARARAEGLRTAAADARLSRDQFIDQVVDRERAALREASVALYRSAAREVLGLVRPRSLPFGSHKASPADRDYLISLFEAGYDKLLGESTRRTTEVLMQAQKKALATVAAVSFDSAEVSDDIARTITEAIALLEARVFGRTLAYLRGYLAGGFVDEFFERVLPKVELTEDAVYDALFRGSADLDGEISVPMARAGIAAMAGVCDNLEKLAAAAEVAIFEVETGPGAALRRIDELLTDNP